MKLNDSILYMLAKAGNKLLYFLCPKFFCQALLLVIVWSGIGGTHLNVCTQLATSTSVNMCCMVLEIQLFPALIQTYYIWGIPCYQFEWRNEEEQQLLYFGTQYKWRMSTISKLPPDIIMGLFLLKMSVNMVLCHIAYFRISKHLSSPLDDCSGSSNSKRTCEHSTVSWKNGYVIHKLN